MPESAGSNEWAAELLLAAEEAQHRQDLFLATAVHELRRPLAPIRNAATLLGRVGTGDTQTLARLQLIIERQVVHLARLVDDLLDLSRSRTGKLQLHRSVVDLRDIVGACVEACRPAAQRRRQELVVVMPTSGLEVEGDPVRLAQVVGNLLDNASKFTPEGGAIDLLVVRHGDLVLLTVTDNGIGIGAAALPHVFHPFSPEASRAGADDSGLGLGLAVVSELVAAHGGSVRAYSAGLGLGSCFVVSLPCAASPSTAGQATRERDLAGA